MSCSFKNKYCRIFFFIWLAALDTVWSAAACLHTRVCSYNTLILTMLVSSAFCGSYERAERGLRMSNIFVGSRVTPQLHYTKMANYFIKIRKEHDSLRGLRRKQRAFNLKTFASDCLFIKGTKCICRFAHRSFILHTYPN